MSVLINELDTMAALKAGTAGQHQRIEELMPFFNQGFSLESYTGIIAAFYGFFMPVEERLSSIPGWNAVGIDLVQRRRAELLRTDLRALGKTESQIANLSCCDRLPPLRDCMDGIGCLYVLEGSTLGGQLIAAEMARRFEIDQHSGAAFFLSYGANVGPMWMRFTASVREYVCTLAQQEAAVLAAANTFTSFANWMGKVEPNGY